MPCVVRAMAAPLPNGLLGSPRLLPGAFGSEQPPVDGVPRCGYGHPVTKCAGLRMVHNQKSCVMIYNYLS